MKALNRRVLYRIQDKTRRDGTRIRHSRAREFAFTPRYLRGRRRLPCCPVVVTFYR